MPDQNQRLPPFLKDLNVHEPLTGFHLSEETLPKGKRMTGLDDYEKILWALKDENLSDQKRNELETQAQQLSERLKRTIGKGVLERIKEEVDKFGE